MDTVADITTMDITALVQTEPDTLTEEETIHTDPRLLMAGALLLPADSQEARLHVVATG